MSPRSMSPRSITPWNGFWSRRSDVQRVELYTKVSLYLAVWSFGLLWALGPKPQELATPVALSLVAGTALLMGVIGTAGVRIALAHPDGVDPNSRDARRLLIATAVVVAIILAVGSVLPPIPAAVVTGIVFSGVAWVVGAMPNRVGIAAVVLLYAAGVALVGADPLAALLWVGIFAFLVFVLRISLWCCGWCSNSTPRGACRVASRSPRNACVSRGMCTMCSVAICR